MVRGRERQHALARPVGMPGALWRDMGKFWASLGVRVLASPVHGVVESVAGQHQMSEREGIDMVVLSRDGQRRGWHDGGMPCHGMAGFW